MPTIKSLKFAASLHRKKNRRKEQHFIAEGDKLVSDLLTSYLSFASIFHTHRWDTSAVPNTIPLIPISEAEMKKISSLTTPTPVLGVIQTPPTLPPSLEILQGVVLALDNIQDPGNLGTILRLADWFGVETIICSPSTADAFAPKVVQASMGAIGRINIYYTNIAEFCQKMRSKGMPIIGTFMEGESIYSTEKPNDAVIVLGNEGNGISSEVEAEITHQITIPSYPSNRATSQSLNVAMATGIILAEFRRKD